MVKQNGFTSMAQSDLQRENYAQSCKYSRKGHIIRHIATGNVIFVGTRKDKGKEVSCINEAKREVRKLMKAKELVCVI